MNEQPLAEALGALLDGRPDDRLPPDETAFALELTALANHTQADSAFADALEANFANTAFALPAAPSNRGIRANRFYRRPTRTLSALASLAAVGVLMLFAALTAAPPRPSTLSTLPTIQGDTAAWSSHQTYVLASATLASGFHIWGETLHYDSFYVGLMQRTFSSYVSLIWSTYSDHA
jgi:hypothetical protein